MKFSEKLIALRKKNNLSQEDLAEKLGVTRQSVSKWESNNSYPETDKIVQICNLFDCSMDDLINDSIESIDNIERKNKNNLNIALDSFLEFITKTINMFCDMKFISGVKCVIGMGILVLILILMGLIITNISTYIIENLFYFIPRFNALFERTIESIFLIIWAIISIIIVIHTFKIRYLNYYDKVLSEKDNNDEKIEIKNDKKKIKLEDKPKIIIRDEAHRPFAFLSIFSKIIIFSIKFMLAFFALMLIFSLLMFVALFVISICLTITSTIFVGSSIALIGAVVINVILLLLIINFIFNKNSNYKIMLITFIASVIVSGVGIGITAISFKNIEIKEGINTITTTKEEILKYDENMVITNSYMDEIEYIIDDSLDNDIKLQIGYDDNLYSYNLEIDNDHYGLKEEYIDLYPTTNIQKVYNLLINDLKDNYIRTYGEGYLQLKVVSSTKVVNKLIENTKLLYLVDEIKTDNGYKLSHFFDRISGYMSCGGKYNVKENKVTPNSSNCTCNIDEEQTNRGNIINYSCEIN